MPFLGAGPEDVEEGILLKIEEAIQDIQGIKELQSTARRGSGTVQAEVDATRTSAKSWTRSRAAWTPSRPFRTTPKNRWWSAPASSHGY